ncbi:MAG: acyltransferase domain-containing protein [Gammaproteobacteria bacterium]|nr:acyltransferase domain-containing protein [Gammaproteobacteria bacterium]
MKEHSAKNAEPSLSDIAIIGMSCRFPGANSIDEFWQNLIAGKETIQRFTPEELLSSGESEEKIHNEHYVNARGIVAGPELFDASFFGFSAADARLLDPQHRFFLECGWEALEAAGYASEKCKDLIGVYASMAESTYLQTHILKNKHIMESADWMQLRIANSLTTLGTQLSYRLNLKGPSVNITTACSSSLVTVITACKALLDYDCDLAIAGSSVISIPQTKGYLYQKGGIESDDGHCRAFDADATGTVFSDGVGVVVLKRLSEAIEDRDFIYATIKSWNINNDGSDKAGYTAPSVRGQARCILSAANFASINLDSLQYIETHGTATAMGDPIEINAMKMAFEAQTNQQQFCAIGSVKTNIGHADIAAGMASLIKTALTLKNQCIPASLHYKRSNPAIDFSQTPFYVNSQLTPWQTDGTSPRRAGINSSGIGGTNAFLILEEHQQKTAKPHDTTAQQILILSGKTPTALEQAFTNLLQHIEQNPQITLANIAYTLQLGRTDFAYRKAVICNSKTALLTLDTQLVPGPIAFQQKKTVAKHNKIVFMFPGQGSQYNGMCDDLYHAEPTFSKLIDTCLDYLNDDIKQEVSLMLFGYNNASHPSNRTLIVQPALFIFEYALATFLIKLGIIPDALVGHSIGEYVAACLSGVMDYKTALCLIQLRAQLMEMTEPGSMLAISDNEEAVMQLIRNHPVSIAACNTPSNTVISGAIHIIEDIKQELAAKNILAKRLNTTHAFHSLLMAPILEDFARGVKKIEFQHPTIPFISNISGEWAQDHEVTNPEYWVNHIAQTVRFSDSLELLIENEFNVFLEVGPGTTLTQFIKEISQNNPKLLLRNVNNRPTQALFAPSTRTHHDSEGNTVQWLKVIAELWLQGVRVDWQYFNQNCARARLPLPTYPFERQRFWILPSARQDSVTPYEKQPYAQWFYEQTWKRVSFQKTYPEHPCAWILLQDELGMGASIQQYLLDNQQTVFSISCSDKFYHNSKYAYQMDISNKEHYQLLIQSILPGTDLPMYVINLLPFMAPDDSNRMAESWDQNIISNKLTNCFYSTLFLTQAMIEYQYRQPVHITVVGNELFSVFGETVSPVKATVTGPCRIIPVEHTQIQIKIIDMDWIEPEDNRHTELQAMSRDAQHEVYNIYAQHIVADTLQHAPQESIIAYRKNYRWIQGFSNVTLPQKQEIILRDNACFLLTGGLGGIALTLANQIAQHVKKPRFILISRSQFPPQTEWEQWLKNHTNEDPTTKKILRLQSIVNSGGQIHLYQANIADSVQMQSLIADVKTQFSSIHGVIHCAGTPGGGLAQFKTRDMANNVFEPKVLGTYILCSLLQHEPLDFFVLCSSLAAIVGEASQIDYCSANACLDAFPYSTFFQNSSTLFTSINWNTWQEVGMAVETERPADISYFDRNNDITPAEGAQIFLDTLRQNAKQMIISTHPLMSFMQHMQTQGVEEANTIDLLQRNTILTDDIYYQPPRNEIETQIAKIWQDIFSLDKVGMQDDFFRLGGHSLTALRLLNNIERQFNITISVSTFLGQATTIEKLAAMISSGSNKSATSSSIVIPIRSTGHLPPLFCFHPVAGTIFCYVNLAKYLTYPAPIYGIQDPSNEHGKLIFESLEDMAACYIKEIKKIQKHGPYYLGGLSFGATLATEVARQLRLNGDTIQVLFFFDGWAKFSDAQHIKDTFKNTIEQLYEGTDSKISSELAWQRMQILLEYDIQPIQEPVFLYKANTLLPEYLDIDDPYNYWEKHVKDPINVYKVPGNHETILDEPNIQNLAALVDNMLTSIKEGPVV